jgi:formate-dependent nitrite reductase cytochrome c552 subunit
VTCHVYQVAPATPGPDNPVQTGHTFLPLVPLACRQCHPGNQSVQFKAAVQKDIQVLLASLQPYFDSGSPLYIDPKTLSGDALNSYRVAKFNRDFVEADASGGVHNTEYAEHLLDVAKTILQSL